MLLLPDTLTMHEAHDALGMLTQSLQREGRGGEVRVDASGVRRFDSSALAVLLESARVARGWGKQLRVERPPKQLAELAQLYGVADLLL